MPSGQSGQGGESGESGASRMPRPTEPRPAESGYYAQRVGSVTETGTPYGAGVQARELKELDIKPREKKTSAAPQKAQTPAWQGLMNLSSEELEQRHETAKAERDALSDRVEREKTQVAESTYAAVAGRYKVKETNPIPSVAAASGAWVSDEDKRLNSLRMDVLKKQDEVNDLAAAYYHRKNQEQLAKLETDAASKTKFRSAQELTTDLDTISKALSAPTTYNGMDSRFKSDGEAIKRKYGTDDLQALQRTLTAQKAGLVKELEAKGYDFETMAGYDRMLRQQENYIKRQEQTQKEAEEHPVWASGLSVVLKPLQVADFARTSLNSVGHSNADDLGSYVPANVYDMYATNMVQTIRGTVSKKIEENTDWEIFGQNVGAFLYNTGMSMADSALMVATLGPGSTYLMGLSSAANKSREIIEQGGSNSQAFWGGLTAGVAECVFEKFSVENLLKIKGVEGWKAKAKAVLRQGGIEASEEMLTECANIISDAMVMGDRSGLSTSIKKYRDQGLTEDKALFQACLDSIGQVTLAGVGGFISGVGLAGGKLAINQAGSVIYNRLTQNQQTMIPAIQGAVEGAKTTPTEGKFYFDATDPDNSWKARTYTQDDGKTFVQSKDHQRMYEVPSQSDVGFAVAADGTVVLNDDVVSRLDERDYRDFIKAYSALNLVTQVDPVSGVEIDPKPITIKSDGSRIIITQTGINDVAKKIRGAGIKSQDNVSSLLLLNFIIENAQNSTPTDNKHGKNVPFTDYTARFSVGGRTYDVLLHIKNAKQGDRYHYHTLNEIEVTPVDGSNGASAGTYQTRITSIDSIPQTAQDVKPVLAQQEGKSGYISPDPLARAMTGQGTGEITSAGVETSGGGDAAQTIVESAKNASTGEAAGNVDPLVQAIREQGRKTGTQNFQKAVDTWDGNSRTVFDVGRTSKALQSVGVKDQTIRLQSYKVTNIMKKHAGMTKEIIKQAPEILESPVLVAKSKTHDTRIVVFGEVFDTNGAPVLAALELQPTTEGGEVVDVINLSSLYGKDKNPADFIRSSEIIFLDQNKNRTETWLQRVGLQLPSDTTTLGPIGRITYQDGKVKVEGVPIFQQTTPGVDTETGIPQAEAQRQTVTQPIDPLIADIRSRGAEQTASQPVDPLVADIRSRGAGQTDTDATANFAKVVGAEKGLVYDDYVKNELAKETADRINALAKRLNLRVRFVDSIANGVADGQIMDADIQIAKDAQNPAMVVLGHEVGHWLEKTAPKEYQTIQQFVSQRQQAEIDYRIAEYAAVGKELGYDAAQREFVNDYIGEMIANPETLDRFINENRDNRTLLQKVADALRALWQKLTGQERQQVKTAEDALLAALRASEKQTTALEKAGQTMDFATEAAEAGAEYSIRFDEKGAIAVLEGKFDSDRKAVYSYLQGLVSKDAFATVLSDAQEVYIGKDLPGEYTQSESTKALFERIRKNKFRASHILNDMLLIGENVQWAEDEGGKHGKAAKNGWYYYTTRFATPVFNQDGSVRHYNRYSAQLVVRNDADGKSYLYDVTNIQRESSGIAADGFAEPTIVTRAPSDENSVP